jgi:anti-sigma B factor antagonist
MLHNDLLADTGDADRSPPRVTGDHGFEARVVQADDGPRVVVSGEVDMSTADQLWQVVEAACEGADSLFVDLGDTTFMDSSGLAVLVRAHHRLGERRGAIVVRAIEPTIRRLFEVTGLDDVLAVVPEPPRT